MALTAQEQAELDKLELEQLEAEYAASQGAPLPAIEEAHPDVSWSQRAVVKNFSNSPEASAAYLNKEGFETEIKDGNIYVRKPGEKDFKAVDPSGFDLQDITDLGYDIPSGIASGIATAAGGIGGAVFGGGVGAVPGAMAAGAGSSAGLEALRQKLGQYAGIPQEISGRDIAISGAIGAASPLLFGTGATAAQIAKAGISPQSQRSLVTKGIEKAFPYAANVASGVPTKAVETYIKRTPEVNALIKEGPDAAANVADGLSASIKDQFFAKKKEIGEKLASNVKGSQNVIPTNKIFQPLEDRLQALVQSERSLTPDGQAEIEALRAEITGMKEGLPELISPSTAWELKDQLKDKSNLQAVTGTFNARYGKGATGAEKALSDAAKKSYDVVNNELSSAAGNSGLNKEYTQMSRLQEKLQKYFKDAETTERTLLSLDKQSKGSARKTVESLDEAVGDTGVRDTADLLESYKYFQDPELLPISSGGTTSTSRTGGLSGVFGAAGSLFGEGGRRLGDNIGRVAGGPAAVKKAIQAGKMASKAGAAPARLAPWLGIPYRENKGGN